MPQPKKALQRKRRRKAVPVLAAAGLSFSLASGASAAVGMGADLPSRTALVSQQMTLRDEEITDVSLATFHVFDNESMKRPRVQFAMCGCCGGCGCASGASFLITTITTRRCLIGLRLSHRADR